MISEFNTLRTDQGALLAELREAGCDVKSPNKIRCVFHDDKNPSAGVYHKDGVWRYKCHGCDASGDLFDIRARVTGRSRSDLIEAVIDPQHNGHHDPKEKEPQIFESLDELVSTFHNVTDVYKYTDPDSGRIDLAVIRLRAPDGGKRFMQARSVLGGGFQLRAPAKPWPIYNRARLVNQKVVIIVEGEKSVHALNKAGWIATTSPAGAGNADHADWSPLAGKKVYLWPDNDAPNDKGFRTGIAHMRDVRAQLEKLDPLPQMYYIDPDTLDLPPKGDAVEYIQSGRDVEKVLRDAEPLGVSCELKSHVLEIVAGRYKAVPLPFKITGKLTKALLPQTISVICADPGAGKSFWLMQCLVHWHDQGIKCACLMIEHRREWHMMRALAIKSGVVSMLETEWIEENPEEATLIQEKYSDFQDEFGPCIHAIQRNRMNLESVAEWVEQRAMAGCRVIIVDPVTLVPHTTRNWADEDQKFVTTVKDIAEKFEISILFSTHPRKGTKGSSFMEDIANGAAYSRATQCVMWLKHFSPAIDAHVRVDSLFGGKTEIMQTDRVLSILKASNSRGAGLSVAFNFAGNDLRFNELGIVMKQIKARAT